MKAVVLHLSDIHIRFPSDAVLSRVDHIVRAAHAVEPTANAVALVITGDIAFSGLTTEFDLATTFIAALKAHAQNAWPDAEVFIEMCPGNHDCDFSGSQSIRELALTRARIPAEAVDTEIFGVCCRPQKNYADFASKVRGARHDLDSICQIRSASLAGRTFEFRSFNTAWLSQLHEKPGTLVIPQTALPERASSAEVVISLFHHTYNWLEPTNARQFKKLIESYSDLVFTGHEHVNDAYSRINLFEGSRADYYEGACLQDPESTNSAFSVVAIDCEHLSRRVHVLRWDGSIYREYGEIQPWSPFLRNEGRLRRTFSLQDSFYSELTSPGATFTHPRKSSLSILDLFVHPYLRELTQDSASKEAGRPPLAGEDFWGLCQSSGKIIVFGEELTGKTTLARHLYLSLHEAGMIPLLVNAINFQHSDEDRVFREIRAAFRAQYNADLYEEYRQLDPSRRVLFLDSFHEIQLNNAGVGKILRILEAFFDKVFVFSNDVSLITELVLDDEEPCLQDYRKFKILEFGNELREELIENWLKMGREESVRPDELEHETVRTKAQIDAVLGRNLIPPYPLFILILLQQIEAFSSLKTTTATEGYLYEALITRSLQKFAASVDIDTAYTYLSVVAHKMYALGRHHLTEAEFIGLHNQYCEEYQLDLRIEIMHRSLTRAEVLRFAEGRYRFMYGYLYWYFFARHLRDRLETEDGRSILNVLVAQIHREESAHFLAFLTYLSKSPLVIDSIVAKATSLFADLPPAILDGDTAFVGRMAENLPRLVFQDRPSREARKEMNRAIDRAKDEHENRSAKPSPAAETQKTIDFNVALKSLQILGQTIRNFPGSLPGKQKSDIAHECYKLGLRTLTMLLGSLEKSEETLVKLLTDTLFKDEKEPTRQEAERRIRRLLAWIAEVITLFIVQRVSSAVGTETLRRTFEEVRGRGNSIAFDLVDIAIKLDHFSAFPQEEIDAFVKTANQHVLAMQVLRNLVIFHFYRFPRDYRTKQTCCDRVGLQYQAVTRIEQLRKSD